MKATLILAVLSAVAANASVLRRADEDICRPSTDKISVSDCEGAMNQLMDDAQHNAEVAKTHKGKWIINRGPMCDRMLRDRYDYVTFGTCSVQTFAKGDTQCIDANAVNDAVQKVLEKCANGEEFMDGGEVQLGEGRGVRVFMTKQ